MGRDRLVGGNGGEPADAEHVGELMKGMEHRRPLGEGARASLRDHAPNSMTGEADYLAERLEGTLHEVCLTSQSGLLSAIANEPRGHGHGPAVARLRPARRPVLGLVDVRESRTSWLPPSGACSGMQVLALTGAAGACLGGLAEVWVAVPATGVAEVQELHQPVYHALCAALEERYWPVPP